MKYSELTNLSEEDLKEKIKGFKKELFSLSQQKRFGRVEKPHQFKLIRRDIARIETLLNEREKHGTKS